MWRDYWWRIQANKRYDSGLSEYRKSESELLRVKIQRKDSPSKNIKMENSCGWLVESFDGKYCGA